MANGVHNLSLRLTIEGVGDYSGSSKSVAVSNPLTFTTLDSSFTDLLTIDAAVNNGASSFSAKVYDSETYNPGVSTPLAMLAGPVADGRIQASWDLTDGSGNIISAGPLTVEFTLQTGAGPVQTVRTFGKYISNPFNNVFTVAFGNDSYKQTGWAAAYTVMMCRNVLNWLTDTDTQGAPYRLLPDADPSPSSNFNKPLAEQTFRVSSQFKNSKKQLLEALKNSGNFLWSGHGNKDVLGTDISGGAIIKAKEVAKYLGNPTILPRPSQLQDVTRYKTPYKLVILFACYAYSPEWADAFGIANFTPPRVPLGVPPMPNLPPTLDQYLAQGRATETVVDYKNRGKIPQAFVAWPVTSWSSCAVVVDVISAIPDIRIEEQAWYALFSMWQDDGKTISECMQAFGQLSSRIQTGSLATDGVLDNLKWELSGCSDLRTFDRDP
jgi:hypothetical protein